ncbi:MAG: HEAT repeat domain-containing protein, partial [Bacteroidota bacterium]
LFQLDAVARDGVLIVKPRTGRTDITIEEGQHSHSYVRRAALQALRTLVEKSAAVQAMVAPILNALQDSHSDVRRAALQTLRTLVEKGADVQAMVAPILNALQHSHYAVRRDAREALGEISTESLIAYYWNKKDANVISSLIPRLYEVALTIEDNKNQVALYPSIGKPVRWKRSREEVRAFKELIKTEKQKLGLELETDFTILPDDNATT